MRKPNPLLPHKEGEASTCEDSRVCDAFIKKETAIKGRTGGSVANKAETGSAHRRAGVLKRAGGKGGRRIQVGERVQVRKG